ncbi:MAG: glycosyltransferase [Planctomycetes bacterium]|nr:glycosyltransferase [Planctomycetota bacterium]
MIADDRPRVAVVYHFFPHYRKAIVEELARSARADFTFIGDDHEYMRSIKPAELSGAVKFRLAPTHRIGGPFMWQWGAVRAGMSPDFDTVIFHAVPHWPCTWIGGLAARLTGKRVFFWGHGYLSRPRGLKGLFRRLFYAIPHQHMFYGRRSKQIAIENGWPPERLHVIYNSQDIAEQTAARNAISAERPAQIRRELFGDERTPVVVCTTRLISVRRLDLLIDALSLLKQRGTAANLILVGDGPEREKLAAKADMLKVRVHFEGACYDEKRIAELVMASNVTVAPGKVGLTAMHSMIYGVPVVTHDDADDQMPEWEAILPGKNGSLFRKNDVASLADAIQSWIATPFPTAATREACHAIIRRFWNPDYQRRSIERAVCGEPADDLFDLREAPRA